MRVRSSAPPPQPVDETEEHVATYTDEQKREAVDLYLEYGAAEAATRTSIPRRTISSWITKRGLAQAKGQQTEAARQQLAAKNAERRERIRTTILEKAEDILDRMDQPHVDYRAAGKELHQVEWDTARSGDVKNYAVSFAILIDKYRLEMGEHTSKISVADAESVLDAEIMRLSEQHAARQ